jgi:hypothetical protein
MTWAEVVALLYYAGLALWALPKAWREWHK